MMRLHFAAFISVAWAGFGGQVPPGKDVTQIGPGVTPPRIISKVEPEYSPQARADHIQGTVVFQIIVDERGRPTNIQAVSPLGYGLDEKAQEAIQKWQFQPGQKEGRPVRITATIEVNFRFPDLWFDEKLGHRRTSFNEAVAILKLSNASARDRAIKLIEDLARQKFPAAMLLVGLWEVRGENLAPDPIDGWALVQKAADSNYGPAHYEVGLRAIKGEDPHNTAEKGWRMLRDAATLGSVGDGVSADLDRARRYFRLCAARRQTPCEYNIAHLLLDDPQRTEDEYLQAVAWLELAAEQGNVESREIAELEQSRLTPAQMAHVKTWKAQLVRN